MNHLVGQRFRMLATCTQLLGAADESPRVQRGAQRESLWLLAFGCLSALCLALCGQSPVSGHVAVAASVRCASASASAVQ